MVCLFLKGIPDGLKGIPDGYVAWSCDHMVCMDVFLLGISI